MLDYEFSKALQEALLKIDPELFGDLSVTTQGGTIFVQGQVSSGIKRIGSKIEDVVRALRPETSLVFVNVKARQSGLNIRTEDGEKRTYTTSGELEEKVLDEVSVLYQGFMGVDALQENPAFKRFNANLEPKVRNSVAVLNVIAPIILDKHLQVIDGNLRLAVARDLGKREVPVLVLEVEGARADFLRMALNRSSEFQRWYYAADGGHRGVDDFIDAHPQLQPLLEPLGFFGERLLPVSYFGDTVLRYTIDEYNGQQQSYRQEVGLEAWAALQTKRIKEEERRKQAKKKYAAPEEAASLFDLAPSEGDFLPTHAIKDSMEEILQETKEVAGLITKTFDEQRRAEKEAAGKPWQATRRKTKEKAADLRAEAELAQKAQRALAKAAPPLEEDEDELFFDDDLLLDDVEALDPTSEV